MIYLLMVAVVYKMVDNLIWVYRNINNPEIEDILYEKTINKYDSIKGK